MKPQRDLFIEELLLKAKLDSSIIFISVDMGAPALDQWREQLPKQFIAAGISEQNAINVAAGLSASGKKPYVYMMACWVARCFEQIRYSCAMANLPITILGNGVGLGYAPAGPAHEPTEDLAYMRAIDGLEILSPSTSNLIPFIVNETIINPKLRYIRLERSISKFVAERKSKDGSVVLLNTGMEVIKQFEEENCKRKLTIFSSGYLLQRALSISDLLKLDYAIDSQVIDLCRIKPINTSKLHDLVSNSDFIVSLEEQALSGAFGSAILEALSDNRLFKHLLRFGLDQAYIFENGTREQLLDAHGLGEKEITRKIVDFSATNFRVSSEVV